MGYVRVPPRGRRTVSYAWSRHLRGQGRRDLDGALLSGASRGGQRGCRRTHAARVDRKRVVMILVVGGSGDLGSRIVRRLRDRGEQVRCLLRPATDAAPLRQLG